MKNAKLILLKMAFLFMPLIFSLRTHAQALPTIDSSVFSSIQGSNQGLIDVGFLPQSIQPYLPISTSNWSPWNLGYVALSQVDIDDCTITQLTDEQKSELLSVFTVVNVNGATVSITDEVYCVEYDNGYFTGQCYVDSEGKMLAYSDDLGGHLLQSRFGGNIKSSTDWENLFEDTSVDIYDNNFLLYDNPDYVSTAPVSFYTFRGINRNSAPFQAAELYIPNQYQKGVIVPTSTSNNSVITAWYFNSYDAFVMHNVMGSFDNPSYNLFTITNGTFRRDGITYSHQLQINQYETITSPNNTYDAWLSGRNINNVIFAIQGNIYSSSLYTNSEATTSFKPLQIPEGSTVINYNYYYDYDSINRLENELNNLSQSLNNNYNNQSSISDENFPFYYPLGDTEVQPSEIPFPGVENYPDFEPLPVPQNSPFLSYDPVIQPTPEATVQSFWNFQIPFVENLFKKYPFSIPWDIKNFFLGFTSVPQAPAWNFDYTISVLGHDYTTHFEGDLSDFEPLAIIFRNLITISFIIFLAIYSYFKHS